MKDLSLGEFTEGDLAALMRRPDVEKSTGDEAPLRALSRQISAQYVDLVAGFAAQAFAGDITSATYDQFQSAIDALVRLATASEDRELIELLGELQVLLPSARVRGGHARRRFMKSLRAWVLEFAELLAPPDAERLRGMVVYDRRSQPLLSELANIRGIGPKRLQRLYCAGLFTVEAVGASDPEEVAQVTGIPLKLAYDVVEASTAFADQQRRRVVGELRQRAAELQQVLGARAGLPRAEPELVRDAHHALRDLQAALAAFDDTPLEEA